MKVSHPTGNVAHLFQGQKVKRQGQQGDRKCIISTVRDCGKTYELQNWYADGGYQLPWPAINVMKLGSCIRAGAYRVG